jgi:Na+/H+ antiporter NhaD/arsenite permease-like protein
MFRSFLIDAIILVALVGIAVGRIPKLRMDRPGMALAAAAALLAAGALSPADAFAAVDVGTLALLLAMMIIVANLRMAGFFALAGGRILRIARGPRGLLALVVAASGLLSAFFLNDTICLVFAPLVAEVARRSKRDALPYLIAVAIAANIGSSATIIGNPQNMLIGAQSGIPFGLFAARLAPPALAGLVVAWLAVVLLHPREFGAGSVLAVVEENRTPVDLPLLWKSLGASALMLVFLLAGVAAPVAALIAAALLLITRRVDPDRVFGHVDFGLLVFFAGLFILTRAIERTETFTRLVDAVLPALSGRLGRPPVGLFSLAVAALSNLVSNVPAVMLLRPLVPRFADQGSVWLVMAMASTFAGNLTLLGSVANLIVAEGAKRAGIAMTFWRYFRVGFPVTIITIAIGVFWLSL